MHGGGAREEIDQASGQAPQAPHRRRVAYHEERRRGVAVGRFEQRYRTRAPPPWALAVVEE